MWLLRLNLVHTQGKKPVSVADKQAALDAATHVLEVSRKVAMAHHPFNFVGANGGELDQETGDVVTIIYQVCSAYHHMYM